MKLLSKKMAAIELSLGIARTELRFIKKSLKEKKLANPAFIEILDEIIWYIDYSYKANEYITRRASKFILLKPKRLKTKEAK